MSGEETRNQRCHLLRAESKVHSNGTIVGILGLLEKFAEDAARSDGGPDPHSPREAPPVPYLVARFESTRLHQKGIDYRKEL